MDDRLKSLILPRRLLVIAAAPAESRAVAAACSRPPPDRDWQLVHLSPEIDLVQCGVGKVNAAICAARITDPKLHAAVINMGIAGSLGPSPPALGTTILATSSVYADEGLATPDGFLGLDAIGFPLGGTPAPAFTGSGIPADPDLTLAASHALAALPGQARLAAPVATVSTCSGVDALAAAVFDRTGASAEAMEGAAIAHTLRRLHGDALRFLELRVISNTTGDRTRQKWDIRLALSVLTRCAAALLAPHTTPPEPTAPAT